MRAWFLQGRIEGVRLLLTVYRAYMTILRGVSSVQFVARTTMILTLIQRDIVYQMKFMWYSFG